MLVYPAVAFQQTASWEDQRRIVIDLRQQGRLHEAFDGARRYLSAAERHQPGAAPLALALQDYAVIAADLGLYGEADTALNRALKIVESAPVRDEVVIHLFRMRLAEVYLDAGRINEARTLFVALQRFWEQTQPGSEELARSLQHLAWIEVQRRNLGSAESLLQRSIAILEARRDVNSWQIGDVLNDYAGLLFTMKRYADAASYADRAQSLQDRQDSQLSATLINSWTMLGAAYAFSGRVQEAESYMRRSIAAAQSIFGEDSRRVARVMSVGAVVLQQCGRKAEAKNLKRKAGQIFAKAVGDDPGRFTIDVNSLR